MKLMCRKFFVAAALVCFALSSQALAAAIISSPPDSGDVLPEAEVSQYYEVVFTLSDDSAASWDITGLPEGLSVDVSSADTIATVKGVPVSPGSHDITVSADSASRVFTLFVRPASYVAIDAVNFPDPLFRAYVKANFDKDSDDKLSGPEIVSVDAIPADDGGDLPSGVASLKGIEHFSKLQSLTCSGTLITTLDLSGNPELTYLDCSYNSLRELDLANNKALAYLDCSFNMLASLDISSNTSLDHLDFMVNSFPRFDISPDKVPEDFYCDGQQVSGPEPAETGDAAWPYSVSLADLVSNDGVAKIDMDSVCAYVSGDREIYGTISGDSFLFREKPCLLTYEYATGGGFMDVEVLLEGEYYPQIFITSLHDGFAGQSYDLVIFVKGERPVDYSIISGELPAGVALVSGDYNPKLSGTPASAGLYSFTIQADNVEGPASRDFILRVWNSSDVPVITTESPLPSGKVGVPYSVKLSADTTLSEDLYWDSFSFADIELYSADILPNWLSVSHSGEIYGTPESADTFTFWVSARNSAGDGIKRFTLTIRPAGSPEIVTSSLPEAVAGAPYSAALLASGDAPITWRKLSGDLPGGLALNASGDITGIPAGAGSFDFTVEASNDKGRDSRAFRINVVLRALPVITTSTLPDGTAGVSYDAKITLSGDTTAAISLASGDLPSGLVLSSDGSITGIPERAGTFTFTVRAASSSGLSSSKTFTVNINASGFGLVIITSSLPSGVVNYPYSADLVASGDNVVWRKVSGDLPDGLALSSDGKISGTPTTAGTFAFTAEASGDIYTASRDFSIIINAASAPSITTTSLPSDRTGTRYAATLEAAGTQPITWSIIAGSLPSGLELDGASGGISGTPSSSGNFAFTVNASNVAGSASRDLTITITRVDPSPSPSPSSLTITTSSLPSGRLGTRYSASLSASSSVSSWAVSSGSLPDGLELDSSGVITGLPSKVGRFTFTVSADGTAGTAFKQFTIEITDEDDSQDSQHAPEISTPSALPGGTVGSWYSVTLAASGKQPITFEVSSGNLPDGLSLKSSGELSGTPSRAGTFTFTVNAHNTVGDKAKSFTLTINDTENAATAPSITSSALPSGTEGTTYNASLNAEGTAPITWEVTGGNLPDGLNMDASGNIWGIPSRAGTFTFSVKAENDAGQDTRNFTITITAAASYAVDNGSLAYDPSINGREIYSMIYGDYDEGDNVSVVFLSGFTVTKAGKYAFVVSVDENIPAGWGLSVEILPADGVNFDGVSGLTVKDSSGVEIAAVPADHRATVEANFARGSYAPILRIRRPSSSQPESADVAVSGGGGGGGCSSVSGAVMLLALAVALRKR